MEPPAHSTGHRTPMIDRRPSAAIISDLAARLSDRIGVRISIAAAVREQHGHSLTWLANQAPDIVVYPQTTQQISEIVTACAALDVPVVAFGAGTSLEGQVNAPYGGVSIDMSGMNRIVAVHEQDFDCVVEPGVTRRQLNEFLRDKGLFFPVDPGSDASIGGMVATRASGTNAVRYGTMRDAVLALTVVLPNGEVVKTSNRARKSSAGYDLTRLFVGSEGTLGIVTEVILRLHGLPEAISVALCPFGTVKDACEAVIATIQLGIPVARIELLDEVQVRAVNLYSKIALPESPLIMLEFHGSDASVAENATRFGEVAEEFGGGPFQWAIRPEDRLRLWQARHDAYWAAKALRPGSEAITTDVCVPISRLAECLDATKQDVSTCGLVAPIVGHVGDGNFHVAPLIDMNDAIEREVAEQFVDRLVRRAISMDGTCSGEHGIGQAKLKYLALEHGRATLDLMNLLKQAIDPRGIMNPGKMGSV